MSLIRSIFAPILLYCGLNSIFLQVSKKRFGETIPITIIISVLLYYFCQFLFKTFTIGWILLLVISAAGYILLILIKDNRKRFFSSGLCVFLIICCMASVWNYHRDFMDFDEFWHWGMMVKESIRLDRFYCVEESRMVIHKDYPPFLPILEMIWVKAAGHYSEGIITTAVHVLILSCICPPLAEKLLVQNYEKKGNFIIRIFRICATSMMLLVIVVLTVFSLDYQKIYQTILADVTLGILFAYGMILIACEDIFKISYGYFSLILTGIALLLTKQAGIAILPILWLLYLLLGWGKQNKKIILLQSFFILFIPFAVYYGWNLYIKELGVSDIRSTATGNGQFGLEKIDPNVYIKTVFGKNPGLQQDTFRNFINAVINDPVTNTSCFSFSFLSLSCLVGLWIILLNQFFSKDFIDHKAFSYGLSLFCGTLGYIFMLSVSYIFCFTKDEMQNLICYERYADSFLIGEFMFLLVYSIILMARNHIVFNKLRGISAVFLFYIIVFSHADINPIMPAVYKTSPYEHYKPIERILRKRTVPDSATTIVYDISNGRYGPWYGSLQSVVYYYLNDRDLLWGQNLFRLDYSKESNRTSAIEQLQNSDYLCIIDKNENLEQFLSEFVDVNLITEGTVFRVISQENDIKLEIIE